MNDILSHTENGITTLTIDRPDKKNSLTSAMYAALADGLTQARTTRPCAWCCFRVMRLFSRRETTSPTS